MSFFILFIFGLIIGSFINVLSLRYNGEGRIFSRDILTGHSRCPDCLKNLRWYELVPLFSFLIQGAKCRHCAHSLNWQYPLIETVTAFLTASIPYLLFSATGAQQAMLQGMPLSGFYLVTGLWLLTTYTFITLSIIDLRLRIIPDQSNVLLIVIGAILLALRYFKTPGTYYKSFGGAYAQVIGEQPSLILNTLLGITLALVLFGGIILFTRGKGMGLGDLKLAVPIALILGWPDTLIAFVAAFIIGAFIGIYMILSDQATMKGMLPFGPFMIVGVYVAMFYGENILRWYFSLA